MVVSFVNAGLLDVDPIHRSHYGCQHRNHSNGMAYLRPRFQGRYRRDVAYPLFSIIALPLFFSGKSSRKSIGEFVFGFAFLFMGLQSLKAECDAHGPRSAIRRCWLSCRILYGYGDCFSIHLVLTYRSASITMIVQASAATMAITLIMCANGWIDYHLGVALVLGENIGTTITANLAALTGNTQARRAGVSAPCFQRFRCHVGFGALLPFHECRLMVCYPCNEGQ